MSNVYTKKELMAFEEEVAELFNNGEIPYPVHLESGNEGRLSDVFLKNKIGAKDYVFGSWRLHLKALLKGVPKETLMQAIKNGHSMALNFPAYKVFGSAIVGGIIPIAVGAAMGIQRRGGEEYVFCFLGDMTSTTGIFRECHEYAINYDLPILFVIEDNAKSVCTDTRDVWQREMLDFQIPSPKIIYYQYESKWPHAGAGQRVQF